MASGTSTLPQPPQRLPLPPFLLQSKEAIHAKWEDLEWQQRNRDLQGSSQHSHAPSTSAYQTPTPSTYSTPSPQPPQFTRLPSETTAARNRYANIEPYARNRIRLRVHEGVNDYINASPIRLGRRRYIATQGPKNTSVNHFYRMLAAEMDMAPREQPAVVIMLTQTHESGREKCFQYYPLSLAEPRLPIPHDPEVDAEDGFEAEVQLLDVQHAPVVGSEVRKMVLRTSVSNPAPASHPASAPPNGSAPPQPHTQTIPITHLLFSAWPDFAAPEGDDRLALVRLVQLSATLNNQPPAPSSSPPPPLNPFTTSPAIPRIVHCSAGVGRTGTFIALDFLLHAMWAGDLDALVPASTDPIADTVDALRVQRPMMVQAEPQFHFLYDVLRDRWLDREARLRRDGGGGG